MHFGCLMKWKIIISVGITKQNHERWIKISEVRIISHF